MVEEHHPMPSFVTPVDSGKSFEDVVGHLR